MNENKTNINWYPGHMAKTKKQIIDDLRFVDVVVELLDARIPYASQNPDIKQYIKGKKRVIVLNKADLADEKQNQKWIAHFEKEGIPTALANSNSGVGIDKIIKKIEGIYSDEKFANKGRIGKSIRVMILGIPNVGKSSFINRVTKKNSAQVGNRPGVTKQKQWVRINENIELLDTPGVLWPKFESEEVGLKLAYVGSIKEDVIEIQEVGFSLLKYLLENYKLNILERYKIEESKIEKMQSELIEENEKVLVVMEEIGRKRGALMSGGRIDLDKVAKIILEDFREGKLGKITLENI